MTRRHATPDRIIQNSPLEIHVDTTTRGTPNDPAYFVYVRYGNMPQQEVRLEAKTMDEAKAEVERRFAQ